MWVLVSIILNVDGLRLYKPQHQYQFINGFVYIHISFIEIQLYAGCYIMHVFQVSLELIEFT